MLRTYKTFNSIVEFSKYEFNNKLLNNVILLRVYTRCNLNPTIYRVINVECWHIHIQKLFFQCN